MMNGLGHITAQNVKIVDDNTLLPSLDSLEVSPHKSGQENFFAESPSRKRLSPDRKRLSPERIETEGRLKSKKGRSARSIQFSPESSTESKAPCGLPKPDMSTKGIDIFRAKDRKAPPPTPCVPRSRSFVQVTAVATPHFCAFGSLPTPEFSVFENSETKKAPPPTPAKLSRHEGAIAIFNKYLNIIRQLEAGSFSYGGRIYAVEKIEGAKGQYKQAFRLSSGQRNLISNIPNEEIIIKAYHEDGLRRNSGQQDAMTRVSCKQYLKCMKKGIPVAEILNLEEQKLIGNVFIQRRIPYSLNNSQWKIREDYSDPLKGRNPEDFPEIVALKFFFEKAIQHLINLDLNAGNFRFTHSPSDMQLVDFREVVDEDDFDVIDTISNIFKDLEECSGRRYEIFKYLTERFSSLNSEPAIASSVKTKLAELAKIEERIAEMALAAKESY